MNSFHRRAFLESILVVLGAASHKAIFASTLSGQDHPVLTFAKRLSLKGVVTKTEIAALSELVSKFTDHHGRITPELQLVLFQVEGILRTNFAVDAASAFQTMAALLGAKISASFTLPEDSRPLWQLGKHPLGGYQSRAKLPQEVDFVVIGAGLTGVSAAFYLSQFQDPKNTAVLDALDPACQASGRNGGNFQLIPENFVGSYEGLLKEQYDFLREIHPKSSKDILESRALAQTVALMRFGRRNSLRFQKLVKENHIDCDFSPSGWLRIAGSKAEEEALHREAFFARNYGLHFELWFAERIRAELKIPASFGGRLAPESGNYDPFKFTIGLLKALINQGTQLYTQTEVEKVIQKKSGTLIVKTSRGEIKAKKVVVATNAFSAEIFPELATIKPYQSQIMNLEHVENTIQNMTVTENQGDLYYNFPLGRQYIDSRGIKRGTIHVGGGLDTPVNNAHDLPVSFEILKGKKDACNLRFADAIGQPPSRAWTGPMGFTDDRVPHIGFLQRFEYDASQILVAAGFNGYGGSFCVEAGYTVAYMAAFGKSPQKFESDIFSPQRFLTKRK